MMGRYRGRGTCIGSGRLGGGKGNGGALEEELQRVEVGAARDGIGILGDGVDDGVEDGVDDGGACDEDENIYFSSKHLSGTIFPPYHFPGLLFTIC